jgi:hypothetical protein
MAIAFLIQDVLTNWDYQKAYSIYLQHCTSKTIAQLLAKETTFNTLKLKRELTAISQEVVKEEKTIIPLERISIETSENEPEDVRALRRENLQLFKEASALHNQLELLTEAKRRKAAFEILELFKQNDANWEKIVHYKRFGFLPTHKEKNFAVPENDGLKFRRITNLRTYLAKAKKNGNTEKAKEFQDELNELLK